jgi:hypothetical protein
LRFFLSSIYLSIYMLTGFGLFFSCLIFVLPRHFEKKKSIMHTHSNNQQLALAHLKTNRKITIHKRVRVPSHKRMKFFNRIISKQNSNFYFLSMRDHIVISSHFFCIYANVFSSCLMLLRRQEESFYTVLLMLFYTLV